MQISLSLDFLKTVVEIKGSFNQLLLRAKFEKTNLSSTGAGLLWKFSGSTLNSTVLILKLPIMVPMVDT